jgi:PST family polysaccharide transporter
VNIVRAGFYSSIATAARLLAALVVIKLVAWLAGPEGVGKLGQFMSLMSLLAVLAGGGISAGIVKYVAEYRHDTQRLERLLAAALWYALCASVLMACLALLFARQLAQWLLDDTAYAGLIRVLAVAQLGIVVAVWLARWLHLYGALLALVLGQLLWLLIGLPAWWRSPYFRRSMLRLRFDREMTFRLAAFSVMTLSSALLSPLVNIAVRDHLALELGWQQVGYWQAVSKVSDAYLLFLTTAINIYYLPKLAAIRERAALAHELRHAYRYLLPAVVSLAAVVYLLRDWLTRLLFSADFAPANALYAPQLAGDVVKIAAFVLSYVMLAKAMTRLFVFSECAFAASYLVLVYLFTARFGLVGAMYAFVANYLGYLVFNVLVVRRYLERV